MKSEKLIETLTTATTPLVELTVAPDSVAELIELCNELQVSYRIPAVRVIVNRERFLAALLSHTEHTF